MTLFAQELTVAVAAAREAGAAILPYYLDADIKVTHKGPRQPLTEADLASNRILRNAILKAFPSDAWLSEEDADDASRLNNSRVWIVDPLDGTQDFIEKNPEFAVSVGLAVDGQPCVGVIFNPVTDELFYGAKGQGAFCQGRQLKVTDNTGVQKIHLFTSQSETKRGEWKTFENMFQLTPRGGSAYKMASIAAGKADGCFTLQPKSEWDVCAGHLLVLEAGGIVTKADGSEVRYNSMNPRLENIVYSNPHVHIALLGAIRERR